MTLVAEPPTIQTPVAPEVAPKIPQEAAPAPQLLPLLPLKGHVERLYNDPMVFLHWLEELPAGTIVGQKGDARSCPLATFGQRMLGVQRLNVWGDRIQVFHDWKDDPDTEPLRTPLWCSRFIVAIDHNREQTALVPAAVALQTLRGIIDRGDTP